MHVKVLDESVAERAKARGIDVLVYAPHFTRLPDVRARAEGLSDDDLLVVPAREVFTGSWRNRRHVLAVGLDAPIPDFVTFEGAVAEMRRQGAAVLIPHPDFATVSVGAETLLARAEEIHAAESYNAKCLERHNRRAREIIREADVPPFGSSYAHLPATVGEAWTEFDREIDSEAALVEALRERVPRRVFRRSGVVHRVRGWTEFAHLFYENTWGKVDRLFLSGMEPTHPRHVAYEGRFDDVAVY
ncbi:MAG: PHP-associated domain-containing protein [Salinigranum sp.]